MSFLPVTYEPLSMSVQSMRGSLSAVTADGENETYPEGVEQGVLDVVVPSAEHSLDTQSEFQTYFVPFVRPS